MEFVESLLHRDISNTCAGVALGLMAEAILASAGFAITHKGEIAKGIGVGTGIAIIVGIIEMELPASCFRRFFLISHMRQAVIASVNAISVSLIHYSRR